MDKITLRSALFSFLMVTLLSSCSRGPASNEPRIRFVDTSTTTTVSSSSTTVTTTTAQACVPAPSFVAQAIGTVVKGSSATIRFTGYAVCGSQFRVVGFDGVSSNQTLDISDVFTLPGVQIRQYSLQLVNSAGTPSGNFYTAVVSLVVADTPTSTTMITSTTLPTTQLPSCTLERVVNRTYPPTSNGQQSIWVRFEVYGNNVTSTLNNQSLASGMYEVRTHNFPFYELEGRVTNSAGTSLCRLSVQTSHCLHSVSNGPTATSVTTTLTVKGTYDNIQIQGVSQPLPVSIWNFPSVTYQELFTGSSQARTRTTTGEVSNLAGDSWSCPVTYTVPAQTPVPPPTRSVLQTGEQLLAGESLVPSGPNTCSCRAVMQGDGNFVVYKGNSVLWNSKTWNNPGARMVFQGDGNAVVYKNNAAKWNSGTARKGGWIMQMQDDCNLVIYTYNYQSSLWSSNSSQRGCY